MRKINYRVETIAILRELSKKYPDQALSTHLAIALSDYIDFYGISDKELFFIIDKYRCEKELDILPSPPEDIYRDSLDLSIDNLTNEDDEC